MDRLVEGLSHGRHSVEVALRPERTVRALQERLHLGYVHIRFTATRGGTELGVRIDPRLSDVEIDSAKESVHLVGSLTLNYVPVRCIADIDLKTLKGQGYLEPSRD
jgi:hypothetical protein